jgi:lysozyme
MTLREQIQRDEGFRPYPYLDCCSKPWNQCTCKVKGALTIGYGHNLDAHGLPESICAELLDQQISAARAAVLARVPVATRLDDARRDVLINMAYNLGISGLLGFHNLLHALGREDWPAAAAAMLDSKWARQVGDRAHRLADQMRDGIYR